MNISDIYTDLQPLKTERLLLRKLRESDLDDFYAWASDPNVARYVTWDAHKSPDDTREFIGRILTRYKQAQPAPWAIVHRQDNHMIGLNEFCEWDITHYRATFGYVLSKGYWNKGYMTEATRALIDFGFQHMNLNRIDARCRIPNIGSARVMEKCGMRFEGILREVAFVKGRFRDLKLYAIIKRDYLAQRKMASP